MKILISIAAVTIALLGAGTSAMAQTVSFVEPSDGAVVSSPFKVKFSVAGMDIKPAGDTTANTGHHHLLINLTSVKVGDPILVDDKHMHFGKGQTETTLTLPPGKYDLTMQFANGVHQSYGPTMSKTIHVTVK
jgi:hypothetical protein